MVRKPNKSINVKTPPGEYPVSLVEAKAHLNMGTCDADDTYIETLTKVATTYAEQYQNRSYITQTLELRMDFFPAYLIELPRPPSISLASIKYIDTNGDEQTLDSSKYTTDFHSYVARVVPAFNETWPDTRRVINSVTIEYIAGYGAAADVPDTIKQAILLMVGEWYLYREAIIDGTINKIPFGVDELLSLEKVY